MSRAREVGDLGSVVTVDDGKVGIGTSSPEALLHVNGDTASQLILQRTTSGATGKFRVGIAGASNTFIIYDLVQDLERLRITSDGYLRMASGSGGIQFGGDTAAANALDDYEEGTFTPTVYGASTVGTTTYGNQAGYYTKIGRQVFAVIDVNYTAATGTGGMRIGGLPFSAPSLAGTSGVGSAMTQGLNWSGGTVLTTYMSFNTNILVLYGSTDDGSVTEQTMTNESVNLWLSISYLAT